MVLCAGGRHVLQHHGHLRVDGGSDGAGGGHAGDERGEPSAHHWQLLRGVGRGKHSNISANLFIFQKFYLKAFEK